MHELKGKVFGIIFKPLRIPLELAKASAFKHLFQWELRVFHLRLFAYDCLATLGATDKHVCRNAQPFMQAADHGKGKGALARQHLRDFGDGANIGFQFLAPKFHLIHTEQNSLYRIWHDRWYDFTFVVFNHQRQKFQFVILLRTIFWVERHQRSKSRHCVCIVIATLDNFNVHIALQGMHLLHLDHQNFFLLYSAWVPIH